MLQEVAAEVVVGTPAVVATRAEVVADTPAAEVTAVVAIANRLLCRGWQVEVKTKVK